MRSITAKNLRKIARGVGADPKTTYVHSKIRDEGYYHGSREQRWADQRKDKSKAAVSRTIVLGICQRRAYQEAKRMYKGLPPSSYAPTNVEVVR